MSRKPNQKPRSTWGSRLGLDICEKTSLTPRQFIIGNRVSLTPPAYVIAFARTRGVVDAAPIRPDLRLLYPDKVFDHVAGKERFTGNDMYLDCSVFQDGL